MLVQIGSTHAFAETLQRIEKTITARGLTLFAKIDHAAAAQGAGMTLRPTTLLIFGSPKGGTPVMQSQPTAAIDLPLKALVWQDAAGQVWLGYNDPAWIARRHGAGDCPATDSLRKALDGIAAAAVVP